MVRNVLAAILLFSLTGCEPNVESCSAVLNGATRLVLVTTRLMNDTRATIRTFERPTSDEAWVASSEPEPAVVGARGLAWGHPFVSRAKSGEPEKREGDKRTPAGIFIRGTWRSRGYGRNVHKLPWIGREFRAARAPERVPPGRR